MKVIRVNEGTPTLTLDLALLDDFVFWLGRVYRLLQVADGAKLWTDPYDLSIYVWIIELWEVTFLKSLINPKT